MTCNSERYRYDNGTEQLAEVLIALGDKTKDARNNANSYQHLFEGKERELKDANKVIQDRRDRIFFLEEEIRGLKDENWKLKRSIQIIDESLRTLHNRVSKVTKKSAMDKDVIKILTMLIRPGEPNGCSMPNPAHR